MLTGTPLTRGKSDPILYLSATGAASATGSDQHHERSATNVAVTRIVLMDADRHWRIPWKRHSSSSYSGTWRAVISELATWPHR